MPTPRTNITTTATPDPTGLQLLGKVVTADNAATVTFSNIPGTFTDLKVTYTCQTSHNSQNSGAIKFNGDGTAANYSSTKWMTWYGASSTLSGSSVSNTNGINVLALGGTTEPANWPGTGEIFIWAYASGLFKPVHAYSLRPNSTDAMPLNQITDGYWKSTSPITSLTLTCVNGYFINGSVFALYGLG